jgi:Ca2+-binding RTX toxin-like protein
MTKFVRINESRSRRPLWLSASAIAVAAAVAGVAGIAAGPGNAASARHATKASHAHKTDKFKHPKLRHGVLTIAGTEASDTIALRLRAGDAGVLQVDVGDDGSADFSFQRADITSIAVDALGGDDNVRIDDSNGSFTDSIPTTIDGGPGNDTIAGGKGAETLSGGDGNDTIDGNGGNDQALLGAGDDSFTWDPGDGSDRIDGQDGNDTMLFNGAAADERVGVTANGDRVIFSRSPGNVTMNTGGVENIDFNGLGGSDSIGVNNLDGTGVSAVNVDLAGTVGRVSVDATEGDDLVNVSGDANGVSVTGQAARVTVLHSQPSDELDVNGLAGDDSISATGLAASTIGLTLDGGAGNDRISGGPGVETLRGGDGNDTIDGNGGNDAAFLGAGDDSFVWDPGDGSDTVEGQDGTDTMIFNGANIAEQIDLSAHGTRLKLFRTQGNVTMDTAGVELVDVNALGGADLVTVNDLTGTDVRNVTVDLAATLGGASGDGQADRVVVNGTNGDDTIRAFGDATEVTAKGLDPVVGILHPEAANDRLEINTLAGSDTVDSVGLAAGAIKLFVDGLLVP